MQQRYYAPLCGRFLSTDNVLAITDAATGQAQRGDCSTGSTILGTGFDVQGNLANWNGVAYTFDYGNRLRAIAGLEAYRYDAWGRRTRSSSTAGLVESLYGRDGQLLYQRDARTSRRRQYVYLAGSLVAEHDRPLSGSAVTVTYQHTDALGSPVATTDAAKTVLQRSEYEPYGKLLNRPLEDGPAYTGHVSDAATNLVYMQQRYYDPRTARFWSVDPVTVDSAGGNFNRYWYANDNPYRFTDPDGRRSREEADQKRQEAEEKRKQDEARKRKEEAAQRAQRTQQAGEIAVGAMVAAMMTLPEAISPDGGDGVTQLGALIIGSRVSTTELGPLIGAANRPFNASGLSVAARAWAKHAGRPGGTFAEVRGGVAQQNLAAENFVRTALNGTRTDLAGGGFEYRTSTGQGVRFNQDGSFSTLLDPKR